VTATCTHDGCPERGIAKAVTITLSEGDVIHCGHCGQPCDLTEQEPPPEIDNTLPTPEETP